MDVPNVPNVLLELGAEFIGIRTYGADSAYIWSSIASCTSSHWGYILSNRLVIF